MSFAIRRGVVTLVSLVPKQIHCGCSITKAHPAIFTQYRNVNSQTEKIHKLLIFNDEILLLRALTHRSSANENPGGMGDNERLEFLGDAILTFLSGEYLYQNNPEMTEDEMTRWRAALVDQKQLARFAEQIGLGIRMRLGKSVICDGGCQNPNLLSSTFEAVIGAYYLDHNRNIEAVRPLVEQLFDSVPQQLMSVRSMVNSKNRFQQWVQPHISVIPPKYITEKVGGSDHLPVFISKVYVNDKIYGQGEGRTKKEAEKLAAENALINLEKR